MQKIKIIIIGFILGIAGPPAFSQEGLSLEYCRQQAIKYNKQLKSSRFQHDEAIANQKSARTAYLPKLDGSGSLMHIPSIDGVSMPGNFLPTAESAEQAELGNFSGTSDVWMPGTSLNFNNLTLIQLSLDLQVPIYAGGKIRHGNKQANLGVKITRDAMDMTYASVIEKTDKAYWTVIAVNEQVKLAQTYVAMLTEIEEQLADMYELGLAPLSEKLKVSVQKNQAELTLVKAQNGLKLSKMSMNQVLGVNLENVFFTSDTLNPQSGMPDLSKGVMKAINNRPELKALKGQLSISEHQKKIVAADFKPQVGVGVSYSKIHVKDLYEDGGWNSQIAGQVSIPIFHWKESKHKQKAAQMKINQAEMELSNTIDLVSLEVQQIKLSIEETYQSIIIAKRNVEETQEALSETQLSFDVGLNTTTDLLNAQAEWQKARVELVGALVQFEILKTTWLKVTGALNIEDEV